MTIYWTLKSIPELRDLPRHERMHRWQKAYHECFRHLTTWVALFAVVVFGFIGSQFGQILGMTLLGGCIGASIGGFIFGQITIIVARKNYRSILLGNGPEKSGKSSA
ncbi:hypothetical protein H1D31_09125 [Alishewanella sp. BS5-314]|uniref:hypothetical protein n=1 Tax=Alishewanella sp. BS5-314 TaxID=2755587 RepID=UPI0021BBAB2B|nr:hypothetical protein [Alishewanella sp. BS5-314]MCT8126174.1 hypothetical protein [Alishewanella sp. BS5-314]